MSNEMKDWLEDEKIERKAKLETFRDIYWDLEEYIKEWEKEFGNHGDVWNIRMSLETDGIDYTYTYTYHGGCGEYEQDAHGFFPFQAFWDLNYFEDERKKRDAKRFAALVEAAEKRKVLEMKQKAQRYEQYIELKREFENEKD